MTPWHLARRAEPSRPMLFWSPVLAVGLTLVLGMAMFAALDQDPVRAFRVFFLRASRRLKSDRFFTYDYRPEVYTTEGLQWIADNTMKTVLLRHYPGLADSLRMVTNAFTPWTVAPAKS